MALNCPNLYRRLTASVPLLVSIIAHIVLIAIAGYFIVTETVIRKKKLFEEAPPVTNAFQKKVEHRLQIARKSGGAVASPVSAQRIISTATNAVQLPDMPELPNVGASSLSGVGFGASMGTVGAGAGYNTAVGSAGGIGKGFMTMSFLGMTNQHASKVVFVVDISPALMDIKKGGFRAFEIIRTEISRLISTLPPAAEFNVILFSQDQVRLYAKELQPATVANKTAFFEWIKPINANLESLGTRSIPVSSPKWTYQPADSLHLNPQYRPSYWIQALHAALEQKTESVFLITGSASAGSMPVSRAELERAHNELIKRVADLKRQGYDLPAIAAARSKAVAKLRADFNAINRQLLQQKKDPLVIQDIRRVLAPDFQALLKRSGFTLTIDPTGWTSKEGNLMWDTPSSDVVPPLADDTKGYSPAEWSDALSHISRLQYGLLRKRASVNIFLFVGPSEKSDQIEKYLSAVSSKNGGKFSLLTTKRLEELTREEPQK